jgi:hypothetical protein
MQKFNPDCFLYVRSCSLGKSRSAFACQLIDPQGQILAQLAGEIDGFDPKAADLQAVLTGLRVAVNLRREKVAIGVHEKEFNINFLERHRSAPGTEKVKSIYLAVQAELAKVRFHRVDQLTEVDLQSVTDLAKGILQNA